jgi:feruloyl esterase
VFVVGHPEKLIDFAYRAVHEMTLAAKAITAAYYGKSPARAYFNGCSTGGRQALTEAQRYPADYDGIVAGAAANYPRTARRAGLDHRDHQPKRWLHPARQISAHSQRGARSLRRAGRREGPRAGRSAPLPFRSAGDVCKGPDAPTCLTPAQVEVARKIYAGPGASILSGPGTRQRTRLGHALRTEAHGAGGETYQYLVFKDPNWDYLKFDPARDIASP